MKSLSESTGLTNFNPKDILRYKLAVALHGNPNMVISYRPMRGYERAGRGSYSLHNVGEERDCSSFWRVFDSLKNVLPTETEKFIASLPHNQPKPVKAPPVGLRPRRLVIDARVREIFQAIERYLKADVEIPQDWLDEQRALYAEIDREYDKQNPQKPTAEDLLAKSLNFDSYKLDLQAAIFGYIDMPRKGQKYRNKQSGKVLTVKLVEVVPRAWIPDETKKISRTVFTMNDGTRVNKVNLLADYERVNENYLYIFTDGE